MAWCVLSIHVGICHLLVCVVFLYILVLILPVIIVLCLQWELPCLAVCSCVFPSSTRHLCDTDIRTTGENITLCVTHIYTRVNLLHLYWKIVGTCISIVCKPLKSSLPSLHSLVSNELDWSTHMYVRVNSASPKIKLGMHTCNAHHE